jgi:hypothetical protein
MARMTKVDKKRVKHPYVGMVMTDIGLCKVYACAANRDPRLRWADNLSFDGSVVSLHVHERIYPRLSIKANLVDCMGAFRVQLVNSTQVPVGLWCLTKKQKCRRQTLFLKPPVLENQLALTTSNSPLLRISDENPVVKKDISFLNF